MMLPFFCLSVCVIWLLLFWFHDSQQTKAPQFTYCNRSCQRFLFRVLWNEGYFPIVGHRAGKYEVDLAFPHKKIAIECGWNDWEMTDLERARSKKRKIALQEQGWKLISLSPKEIYGNPRLCLAIIEQNIAVEQRIY